MANDVEVPGSGHDGSGICLGHPDQRNDKKRAHDPTTRELAAPARQAIVIAERDGAQAQEGRAVDYSQLDGDLAMRARASAERIRLRQRDAIIGIGQDLSEMKEALGHGHFRDGLRRS